MNDAFHSEADTAFIATDYKNKLRPPRLAWAPLPVFFVAVIGLWLKNTQTPGEAPELLIALNLILTTAPFAGIAYLFFRSFLITGVPGVALFGCGAILWSASGLAPLGAYLASAADAPNINVTIHNLLIWAASLTCLAGAALLHRGWPAIKMRTRALLAAYGLALAAAAFIAFAALKGLTPVFFVQGQGATLERQFVLGSTIFAILLTLSLLRKEINLRSPFLDWFSLALMLLAIGYAGLMPETTFAGVLGWVSCAAQYFGGLYMLIAAYAAFRDAKPAFVVLAPSRDRAPHRYSIAIVMVLIAAVVRLVFLEALGTRVAFVTFYPAVMLAAFYGGFRAGAVATAVAAAVADYFWIAPARSFAIGSPSDGLAILIFVVSCSLISWIVGLLQKTQARVRGLEADRRAELERMVAEGAAELALANEAKTQLLAAATATEAELQAVLDAVPAGIWITRDPTYRTVQANRLATAWMRIPEGANSSKSTPGLLHFDIFNKDGQPVPNQQLPLRRAARGEEVTDYEFDWRFSDGERRFLYGNATPMRDADGNIAGGVAAFIDITERKQAEEALRRSEIRYRTLVEATNAIIWSCPPSGLHVEPQPAWMAFTGQTAEEMLGDGWTKVTHPEDVSQVTERWLDAVARGEPFVSEHRIRRHDGCWRWISVYAVPIRCAEGEIVEWFGMSIDISERKQAEAALRASEERFRGIFQDAGTGIAITDLKGRFQACNPAFTVMLGYTEEELLGRDFQEIVHPKDREENAEGGVQLRAQKIPSLELFNRYIRKDGSAVWVHKRVSMLHDATGAPTHHIALVTDMTERKRYEEHINLLMREVNHRAKNMLAVVQAIARQTTAPSTEDFIERFGERVRALGTSLDLLVKSEWRGVDLQELIRFQLAHFADLIGVRIDLCGPKLSISASAAQTLGMALNELATNAGKYGALSNTAGRVEIAWTLEAAEDGAERFVMSWRESGGPPVTQPVQTGFGSTVISSIMRMSLDADVDLDFAPAGLTWRLRSPAEKILEGYTSCVQSAKS